MGGVGVSAWAGMICLGCDGLLMRPEALRSPTAQAAARSKNKLKGRLSKGERANRCWTRNQDVQVNSFLSPCLSGPQPADPGIYCCSQSYIGGGGMTKRLIDLDDDLLAQAQQELGTSGVSDTVRLALQQAAAASARARQVEWLASGGLGELTDPDARAAVWR